MRFGQVGADLARGCEDVSRGRLQGGGGGAQHAGDIVSGRRTGVFFVPVAFLPEYLP